MERGYRYLVYFFVLILCLAPLGFRRYLIQLITFQERSFLIHLHAALMTLWCLILIIQPILIKKRKLTLHRALGTYSYFLVPLIVTSMIAVMLLSFTELMNEISLHDNLAILFFPTTQIFIFSIFYLLAMIYRKRTNLHMRYIIISSITLLGPTIGRLDFDSIHLGGYNWDLIFMDVTLLSFLLIDLYHRKKIKYYLLGLMAYLSTHLLIVFNFQETDLWQTIAFAFIDRFFGIL